MVKAHGHEFQTWPLAVAARLRNQEMEHTIMRHRRISRRIPIVTRNAAVAHEDMTMKFSAGSGEKAQTKQHANPNANPFTAGRLW